MKNKGLCLVILICMMVLVGCQDTEVEKESASDIASEEMTPPVEFTSENKKMSITLPDDSWTVEEDSDNLCMFSSRHGVIMLSEVQDDDIVTPQSEEDLKSVLQKEGYNSQNFEVVDFSKQNIATLKSYKAVVKYDKEQASYAYGILYGTVLGDVEYMASAILYSESLEQLEKVKVAINSFEVNPDAQEAPTQTPIVMQTPTPTKEPEPIATPEPTPEPTAIPEPTATPEPTPTPGPVTRTVKQSGNVRSAPNETDSTIWGTIPGGTSVLVYGQVNGWYEVEYNGQRGYIYKRFID